MKRTLAILACVSALLFSCAIGTHEVAGGSGAGNPGVTASVSIMADTITIPPATLEKAQNSGDSAIARALPLSDDSSMVLTATSAAVTVFRFEFLLDDTGHCDSLVDSFPELSCDTAGMLLDGPFVFDMVSLAADSLFDSLRLPAASYRGMKLAIGCRDDADSTTCSPVVIAGTFNYRDTLRQFTFTIPFSTKLLYKYSGQPVEIDPADTAIFKLTVSARQWLAGVDIAGGLNSGSVPLDSTGNLVINGTGVLSTAARAIAHTIRANIDASFANAKFDLTP